MTKSQWQKAYSLERQANFRELRPLLALVKRVKYPILLGIMAQIHSEIKPKLEAIQKAEDRCFNGVEKEHSNAYGKNYSTSDFRGQLVRPGGNDNGMEENENLWTAGNAMKERDSVKA